MRSRHLKFSELIDLAQSANQREKMAHVRECERCSKDYTVAVALVSKSQEQRGPIEIVIGEITSVLKNISDFNGTPKWEAVGSPQIFAVDMCADSEGLKIWLMSGRYKVGRLKVKIYKRMKEKKQWIEHKSGVTTKNGFVLLRQICEDVMADPEGRYIVSIQGILEPNREKILASLQEFNRVRPRA